MRELFYYGRDDQNKPVVTVCLLENGGELARGVAACSQQDNPHKRVGRNIAKERARYAMMTKGNNCVINGIKGVHAILRSNVAGVDLGWMKSAYNPKLTEFEERLLYGDGINI